MVNFVDELDLSGWVTSGGVSAVASYFMGRRASPVTPLASRSLRSGRRIDSVALHRKGIAKSSRAESGKNLH